MVALALAGAATVAGAAPITDAVAGYTMETVDGSGNLVDVTGNGHNASNGLGGATQVAGPYGNALAFDGTDQVVIPDAPDLRRTTDFTIEAAFRIDALAGDWVRVVGKGDFTYRNYGLWYHPDGSLLFQIYGISAAWNAQYNIAGGIPTGQWMHMAGVYDAAAGTMRLYVDGVLRATRSGVGTPYTSADPLTIGYAGYHSAHTGLIDNVALYGSVLSEADILAHAAGDVLPVPEAQTAGVVLLSVLVGALVWRRTAAR